MRLRLANNSSNRISNRINIIVGSTDPGRWCSHWAAPAHAVVVAMTAVKEEKKKQQQLLRNCTPAASRCQHLHRTTKLNSSQEEIRRQVLSIITTTTTNTKMQHPAQQQPQPLQQMMSTMIRIPMSLYYSPRATMHPCSLLHITMNCSDWQLLLLP